MTNNNDVKTCYCPKCEKEVEYYLTKQPTYINNDKLNIHTTFYLTLGVCKECGEDFLQPDETIPLNIKEKREQWKKYKEETGYKKK